MVCVHWNCWWQMVLWTLVRLAHCLPPATDTHTMPSVCTLRHTCTRRVSYREGCLYPHHRHCIYTQRLSHSVSFSHREGCAYPLQCCLFRCLSASSRTTAQRRCVQHTQRIIPPTVHSVDPTVHSAVSPYLCLPSISVQTGMHRPSATAHQPAAACLLGQVLVLLKTAGIDLTAYLPRAGWGVGCC